MIYGLKNGKFSKLSTKKDSKYEYINSDEIYDILQNYNNIHM